MKPSRFAASLLIAAVVVFAQEPTTTDNANAKPSDEINIGGGQGGLPATSVPSQGPLDTSETIAGTLPPSGTNVGNIATVTAIETQSVYYQENGGNGVLTGIASLFGVLFGIALGVIIWLLVKRYQDRKKGYLKPAYDTPESGIFSEQSPNAQIDYLQAQLADAKNQLTVVQGSLLAVGQKSQTKDDNSLSREYSQINTDVGAWAGNFFKASTDQINLTTELYEFLTEHIPNYQALIGGKNKQLVVRAIVSQVLQESFETGAFFGNAVSNITPLIRTSSAPPIAINNWRSETFFLLEKSDDFSSHRKGAISSITDEIEKLTYPLAATNQSFQGDPARYRFLEGIIKRASDFAVALNKQRANFQLLSEPANCEFGHSTMDDVSQQTDVVTNADGSTSHKLEGKPIQATIFPLLLKYGNESGEGYDQVTILSKAKVLV